MSVNTETLQFVEQQAARLEDTLKRKLKSWRVKGSVLKDSIQVLTKPQSDGVILVEIYFNTEGRFVDMGSGRGYSHGRLTQVSYQQATDKRRARRPKKFYTRPLYGWIYSMQDAVAIRLLDETTTTLVYEISEK